MCLAPDSRFLQFCVWDSSVERPGKVGSAAAKHTEICSVEVSPLLLGLPHVTLSTTAEE